METMNKRDIIAMQLLSGWLSSCSGSSVDIKDRPVAHVKLAIVFADELIKQLKESEPDETTTSS